MNFIWTFCFKREIAIESFTHFMQGFFRTKLLELMFHYISISLIGIDAKSIHYSIIVNNSFNKPTFFCLTVNAHDKIDNPQ